jgi:hypothetical protein
MKKARSFKAAVALGSFTAAVALLSGMPGANAQTAPGGGSMPGSFLVPGTNTSIAFHGIIWFVGSDYAGPHQGDTGASGTPGLPLRGAGVAGGSNASYATNGGMQFDLKPVRFITQTSTPTAYGELKTYFEFDFDQFSGAQLTGSNGDTARLRQGYGTLGPWLIGQTWSTYADLQSWSDGDGGDPTIDSGVPMNTIVGRVPQIRYTFLGGGGLSLAGALEMPITYYNTAGAPNNSNNLGVTPAVLPNTLFANVSGGPGGLGGIQDVPAFAGTAELDQPWGHIAGHIALQDLQIRNDPALSVNNDISKFGYAAYISGHLNTFGKDRLGGGVDYTHGALNYGPSNETVGTGEGIILGYPGTTFTTPGATNVGCFNSSATTYPPTLVKSLDACPDSLTNTYGVYVNYLHYWSDTLRTNIDGGWDHTDRPGATGNWTLAQLSTLQNFSYSTHLNLIWSPVPGLISLTAEWDYFRRAMFGQAVGDTNQFIAQAKFFW